ncbi:hypothetical protein MUK42_17823 [Musa troglodytarum]|uniref:DUF7906 domain-containing protein n=1 Tax=Musa troglodytarum TaxID=320322 RepID=A0A9E7KUZ5_9LILI|nr:hypothetical protein MUK42_17823 [Musa troglodytarum]
MGSVPLLASLFLASFLLPYAVESSAQAFRRDPGHPQWHHGAFHDVQGTVRDDVRRMLHTRAEVPFQVPLEVNILLIGFNGDGGYRYKIDAHKLEDFLKSSFPTHRPSCFETGEPIDIEHHIIYNAIPAGQPELVALEKALKEAMVPAGIARESEYGREFPLFEVEATVVEPIFQRLYSFIFDVESGGYSATEMGRLVPAAIFIVNFDKVRMDPRNKEIDHDRFMYGPIGELTEEELKKQEGDYIYRYRYNGGGASQVWLSSGRFETVDLTTRLLVPIIVLQNHNRYNILQAGHNYSIDIKAIEREVKKMVHAGQEVIIIGGSHALHQHEKLAIAVSKAMRGHSLQETKKDGRFHVHTRTYLDGAILKEEMERSADVLAAGLLEVSDPSLSSKFFIRQHWMDETDSSQDSMIKHKPIWESYVPKHGRDKKSSGKKKQGNLYRTYGTRVIPVFVLSLADVDAGLLMEDESLVWTTKDVVIVLQHDNEKIPLSYVSETTRQLAFPSLAQRHILAGLASTIGGLSAPYERASHIHERPVINWLWASGCHPFGPFSNSSHISQMLQDVALNVQSFAAEHLKTPLGEPVKGKKKKSGTELWVEKFYKKTTNLPEPFPHELVERLEEYLDKLEEKLVDLSSLLYDHQLEDAYQNSSDILQSTIFTQQYVERVLAAEREKMKCCSIQYIQPTQTSQAFIYGGILLAGGQR